VYRVTDESEDLAARAARDKTLYEIGYRPTLATVQEVYGSGYEPSSTGAGELPASDPIAAFAAAMPQRPPNREDQLVAAIAREADPIIEGWVDHIDALVQRARSLEEIRDGLLELLPDLSTERLGQAMQRALAVAGIAGMSDAADDSNG
jgi:hypothetical protein